MGDALASFNPVSGQGMTVAACQADALSGLLASREAGLDGLTADYLAAAAKFAARAWKACIPGTNAPWWVRVADCCGIFCEPLEYICRVV